MGEPDVINPLNSFFPALALPFLDKSDFELPTDHLQHLKNRLPEVDRFLVIGWAAQDTHFLKLLNDARR